MASAASDVNGRLSGEPSGGGAGLSPLDRGFLYGEAVYENFRTYSGVPLLLDRHLERLRRSAAFLEIPVPASDEEIAARIRRACRALPDPGERSVRVILSAGTEEDGPVLVVLARPLSPLPVDPEREGVGVLLSRFVRSTPGGLPGGVKTTGLALARRAVREAEAVGAHEALVRAPDGTLAEGATSNLFWVEDGTVFTPPGESGILPGLTRGVVADTLADLEIVLTEEALPAERLLRAEEAFLTSSSREVLPIGWTVTPDGCRAPVGAGRPGPLTLRILAGYRRAIARIIGAAVP